MVDGKILGGADPVTLLRIELTCLAGANATKAGV